MRIKLCSLFLLMAVLGSILGGCGSSSTPDLSAAEQKQFKGAPRPASANEEMQKSIEEFRKKHPTGGTAPTTGGMPPGG